MLFIVLITVDLMFISRGLEATIVACEDCREKLVFIAEALWGHSSYPVYARTE